MIGLLGLALGFLAGVRVVIEEEVLLVAAAPSSWGSPAAAASSWRRRRCGESTEWIRRLNIFFKKNFYFSR